MQQARRLVRLLCLAVTSYGVASLLLRLWLASLRLHDTLRWLTVVLLNPTILVSISAALLLVLLAPVPAARSWQRALPWLAVTLPWALVLGVAAFGLPRLAQVGVLAPYLSESTGLPGFAPRRCYTEHRGRAEPAQICTNSHGLRGAEWRAPGVPLGTPPVRKILLAGDSFVFGSGVSDAGTLDAVLATELARLRPETRWHVVNVGFPGLAMASYVRMIAAAARQVRPDRVIVGFNKGNDLDPADTWERLEHLGPTWLLASAVLLVESDLYAAEQQDERRWRDDAQVPDQLRAGLASAVNQLRMLGRDLAFRTLIWSYAGPCNLFDAALADKRSGLELAWPDASGWGADPALHIVGDGHPTAAANRLFAQQLAAWIVQSMP